MDHETRNIEYSDSKVYHLLEVTDLLFIIHNYKSLITKITPNTVSYEIYLY